MDGSLSGLAPGSTVTAYHAFNEWEECPRANSTFSNGLVCNPSVRVRKLSIPFTASPLRVQPRELNAKDVLVKKSRKIQPHGFKATFLYTGSSARPTRFEISRLLLDIADFLGLVCVFALCFFVMSCTNMHGCTYMSVAIVS